MSENKTILSTRSGGPSVTAVSMSATQLEVTVKIEKTEPDYDISIESKVRRGKASTLCQRVLKVESVHPPASLLTCGSNKANNSLDVNAALGLHSELDIKLEPEEKLKEEPQDCSLDEDDAVDDNGAPPTDEYQLKTNGTSESHQIVEHIAAVTDANTVPSNYVTRNNKKIKNPTKDDNDSDTKISDDSILVSNIDSGIHSAEEYSCTTCKYTTRTARFLETHLQAHLAARNYICDICSYIATHKYNLISHVRKHTGEQPYACEICNKKFKNSSNINRHVRTHTGEKPYSCKICDKKFTRGCSFIRHTKIHTGEKPFVCKI